MKLEMRTVQKIAAAAMTLAVMFGCASPLKPLAASAAQNTVSVSADIDEENSYISAQDQMYQKDFLKLINKARAKAGLNSVELGDAAHNAAAAERAEELSTTYSYVRPNGQRDFTVFAENGIDDVSVGENYLAGVSTPDSAMDQWMNAGTSPARAHCSQLSDPPTAGAAIPLPGGQRRPQPYCAGRGLVQVPCSGPHGG